MPDDTTNNQNNFSGNSEEIAKHVVSNQEGLEVPDSTDQLQQNLEDVIDLLKQSQSKQSNLSSEIDSIKDSIDSIDKRDAKQTTDELLHLNETVIKNQENTDTIEKIIKDAVKESDSKSDTSETVIKNQENTDTIEKIIKDAVKESDSKSDSKSDTSETVIKNQDDKTVNFDGVENPQSEQFKSSESEKQQKADKRESERIAREERREKEKEERAEKRRLQQEAKEQRARDKVAKQEEKKRKDEEAIAKKEAAEKEKIAKQESLRLQEFIENIETKLTNIFSVRETLNDSITSAFGSNLITKSATTLIDSVGGMFDSLFEKPQDAEVDPLVEALQLQSATIKELIESVKNTETSDAVEKQTDAIERLIFTIEERGGLPNSDDLDTTNAEPRQLKEIQSIENYSSVLNDILLELKQPKTDAQLAELIVENTKILSLQSETLDSILEALYVPNNRLDHDSLEQDVFSRMSSTLSGIGKDTSNEDAKLGEESTSTDDTDKQKQRIPEEKDVTDVKPKTIWERIKSDAFSVEKNVEGFKIFVRMMTHGLTKVYEKLDPLIRPMTEVAKNLYAAIKPMQKHTDFVKSQIDKFKDIVGRSFVKADPTVTTESRFDDGSRSSQAETPIKSTQQPESPNSDSDVTESTPKEDFKIPGFDMPDIPDFDLPGGDTERTNKKTPKSSAPDIEQKSKPIPDGKKSAPGKLAKIGKGLAITAGALAIMTALTSGVDYVLGETAGIGKQDISQEQLDADESNWNKMSSGEKIMSGAARGLEKFGDFIGLENIAKEAKTSRIEKESEMISNKLNAIEEKQSELKQAQENVAKQSANNQAPTQVNNIVNNNSQSVFGSRMNSENTESSFMRYLKSVF